MVLLQSDTIRLMQNISPMATAVSLIAWWIVAYYSVTLYGGFPAIHVHTSISGLLGLVPLHGRSIEPKRFHLRPEITNNSSKYKDFITGVGTEYRIPSGFFLFLVVTQATFL